MGTATNHDGDAASELGINNMRRKVISGGAVLAGAAMSGCASDGGAAAGVTPTQPFSVAQMVIPIVGSSQQFPVRRIYCVGRNYAAHAREMGSDPTREPPFFFQKPTDAIQYVAPGSTANHPYPSLTKNYHYEIELVAALKSGGKNIPAERALDCVF
ncbi:MAG: fumarylacetoacetate hydrolase family protein, partial [Usitatibacteraceae bacterium]